MMKTFAFYGFPMLLAVYMPMCAPVVEPTMPPWDAHMAELWQEPLDLKGRDLFHGPWAGNRAPDPECHVPAGRSKASRHQSWSHRRRRRRTRVARQAGARQRPGR